MSAPDLPDAAGGILERVSAIRSGGILPPSASAASGGRANRLRRTSAAGSRRYEAVKHVLTDPHGAPTVLPAMMFYGVAGSGQSWLLRKLREELPPNLPVGRLEFVARDYRGGLSFRSTPSPALAELRSQMPAVRFPRFDLAIGWLRFRTGRREARPDTAGGRASGSLLSVLVELGAATAASLPAGPLAAWLVKTLGQRAYDRAKEGGAPNFLSRADGESDFVRLARSTVQEIEEGIVDRFLDDLHDHLPSRGSRPGDGAACRALLLFDTMEEFRGASGDPRDRQRFGDDWVRRRRRGGRFEAGDRATPTGSGRRPGRVPRPE